MQNSSYHQIYHIFWLEKYKLHHLQQLQILVLLLTSKQHIDEVTGQAFNQIRELGSIRKVLDVGSTKILVHDFILSHLDYCNVLIFGFSHCLLQRPQYVHNAAARRIALKWKYGHITHIRMALHWLPVKQRIDFESNGGCI